jgi:chromosome partitioning protein
MAYVLAVGSHKGGTGRTTTAMTLAWCWGQRGKRVTLVDADPIRAASLVAVGASGMCDWRNVRFRGGLPPTNDLAYRGDYIVIDCPSLLEPEAQTVLAQCDGLIVCCLADPLSLRTVPAASSAINAAQATNARLDLLGILIGIYDASDAIQTAMLNRLRQTHGELLLEPPVPIQPEMREWPLDPGTEPPAGPALEAYRKLAQGLESWLRQGLGV